MAQRQPALNRVIWVLIIGLIYLFTWRVFLRLTGKWPAPYWLAVGLGVFLIYGFSGKSLKQIPYVFPLPLLSFFVVWFFTYKLVFWIGSDKWLFQHFSWYYKNDWLGKIPVALIMASVMYLISKRKQCYRSCLIFCALLFVLSCGDWLAGVGMSVGEAPFFHIDHDSYGFRLGLFFLIVLVLSLTITSSVKNSAS